MKYYLFLVCFLAWIASGNAQTTPKPEAISLAKRAAVLIPTRPDSSLFLLDKAIAVDKSFRHAYLMKSGIYTRKGDYNNAIKAIQKALQLKKDDYVTIQFLGILYDKTGKTKKAQAQYKESIRLIDTLIKTAAPSIKSTLLLNRGTSMILTGDADAARRDIESSLQQATSDPELHKFIKESTDTMSYDKQRLIDGILSGK